MSKKEKKKEDKEEKEEEPEKKKEKKTEIKITPVKAEIGDRKPYIEALEKKEEPKKVEKVSKPTLETKRIQVWKCNSCGFEFEFSGKSAPRKCPNCRSTSITVLKFKEELEKAPSLDSKLLKPIVSYPYLLWAEKTGIRELELKPAESDMLAENLANVLNFYLEDLMKEHGAVMALGISVAMVTVPRIYLVKKIKKDEQIKADRYYMTERGIEDMGEPWLREEEKKKEEKKKDKEVDYDEKIKRVFGGGSR